MKEKEIKEFILKELQNFEFKTYTKGFKYLSETILLCIKDNNLLDNLNKNVYPKIAIKYNEKSLYNVKWCIEQIVKTMYNNTDMKRISDYFNLDYNIKPSVKFIVHTIVCNYSKKTNSNENPLPSTL